MYNAIDAVLDHWPTEWHTTSDLAMGASKSTMQCKRDKAKLNMAQLAKKRKKEAAHKAHAKCHAT